MRLGYQQQLPWTPAVFENKTKWRVGYDEAVQAEKDWSPNYASFKDKMTELEEKIKTDLAEGRMIATTYGEAKRKYQERLLIVSIGLVDEGNGKHRLIHDGTRCTHINNKPKLWSRPPRR